MKNVRADICLLKVCHLVLSQDYGVFKWIMVKLYGVKMTFDQSLKTNDEFSTASLALLHQTPCWNV